MPQFSYRARNAQGGLVEGVLDCPDRAVAIRQIEQLRYIPVRIDTVGIETDEQRRRCRRDSLSSIGHAKVKNPSWPVADFYRTA